MADGQDSFKHRPLLKDPESQIRLLHIRPASQEQKINAGGAELDCTLTVHDLEAVIGRYAAISYTWGAKDCNNRIIHVNGKPVKVRHNCWYALMQMRQHRVSELYWIDYICIDQDAHREKQLQVSRMSDIYANASMVAACVGVAGPREQYFGTISRVFNNDFARGLRKELFEWLSGLRYFNRLWTVQECMLARSLYIFYGNQRMNVGGIHYDLVQYLSGLAKERSGNRGLSRGRSIESLVGSRHHPTSIEWDLADLVNCYANRRCHDPRDKIYGLLALATRTVRARMPISYDATLLEVLLSYTRLYDHFQIGERTISSGPVPYLQRILASNRRLAYEFWHTSDDFRRDYAKFLSKQLVFLTKEAMNDCSRSPTKVTRARIEFSLFGHQDVSLYRRYECSHVYGASTVRGKPHRLCHTLINFDPNEPGPQLPGSLTHHHLMLALQNSTRYKSLLSDVLHKALRFPGVSVSVTPESSGIRSTGTSSSLSRAHSMRPRKLLIISHLSLRHRAVAIIEVPAITAETDVLLECTGSSVPPKLAPIYLIGRPQGYGQCDILGRAFLLSGEVPILSLPEPVIDVTTSIEADDLLFLAAVPRNFELFIALLTGHIKSPPCSSPSDERAASGSRSLAGISNRFRPGLEGARVKPKQTSPFRPRWSGAIAKHIRLRHGVDGEMARRRRIAAEMLGFRSERIFLAGDHEPKLKDCTAFG